MLFPITLIEHSLYATLYQELHSFIHSFEKCNDYQLCGRYYANDIRDITVNRKMTYLLWGFLSSVGCSQ